MKKFNGPGNIVGQFADRDPNTGTLGSTPDASWLNSIQEELCTVVTADGVALNPASSNQILTQINTRKINITKACKIPVPDVQIPFSGDLRMNLGHSTAIQTTDNAGTPVNTPIVGAAFSLNSVAYEIDEYLNGIYPINNAKYSRRGVKLSKSASNFFTQSWDFINYVRGTNPNLREPSARTMFGRAGTRFTKTDETYAFIMAVYGRKIVNADKEHTYAICFNLDFTASEKIRYVRARLAYSANWTNNAQVEIDLEERRVISSNAIRYEIREVDNFLIISATGKSSLTPETSGGGSVDIIPITVPGANETVTATGVSEIMWVQLQEDAAWTSYVETNGQEATKTTDLLTVAGKNFAVNSTNGITFKCKFTPNTNNITVAQYLFDIGGVATNRLGVYYHNNLLFVTNGTTGKSIDITNLIKYRQENTLTISIKPGQNIKFVLNGTLVEITGAFITMPVDTTSTLKIGSSYSGNYKTSIYIRDFNWWNVAFTAEQLLGACK